MNDLIELTITDMAYGGQGIGRYAGKPVFVPFTLPGEEITARIVDDRGRLAFAEGVTALSISADRVLPRCPHFGVNRCSACHWQHIDYAAQLALKTDVVADQLSRIGWFEDAPVQLTLPSPQQWGYRHEAVLYPVSGGFGFSSDYAVEQCHVITPALLELLPRLDFDLPTLDRLILRDNGTGELMVTLSTQDDEPPSLETDLQASINFLLSDGEPANLIGGTHLVYSILGRAHRVTAGSYWRVNPAQIETLITVLRTWLDLKGNECILDLYAGTGILAAFLAPDANLITCVDNYPPAMTDAEENLSAFDHIDLIEGDAAAAIFSLEERYAIAVIDPPAEGMAVEVVDALEALLPPRIVYIGDEVPIMARDLKRLRDRYGYSLSALQPIDFEPQTFKTVSLAYLHRG